MTSLPRNLDALLHIIMLDIRSNKINILLRPLSVEIKPNVMVRPISERSKYHGKEPIIIVLGKVAF